MEFTSFQQLFTDDFTCSTLKDIVSNHDHRFTNGFQ